MVARKARGRSQATVLLRSGVAVAAAQYLLVAGVLRDGLGALGDGVLGQLARQDEPDGGLDLARRERLRLVVRDKLGSLAGAAAEDVRDEGVHDRHGLLGDARVRVHLLEDFVDVHGVRLSPLLGPLLASLGLLLAWGLLRRHFAGGGGGGDWCFSDCCLVFGSKQLLPRSLREKWETGLGGRI